MNTNRIESATSCVTHYRKCTAEFNKKWYSMRVDLLFCFSFFNFYVRLVSPVCCICTRQEGEIVKKGGNTEWKS